MLRTVLSGLKARPARLLLSAVAIALGVAFVAGALVLSDAVSAGLRDAVAVHLRGADATITSTGHAELDEPLLAKVRKTPGVAAAEGRAFASAPLRDGTGRLQDAGAMAVPADEHLRPFDLAEGRFPSAANEIAMAIGAAADFRLGQSITVYDQNGVPHTFALVGTFRRPTDAGIGAPQLVLSPEGLRELGPRSGYGEIMVRAAGVSPAALVAELKKSVGGRGISVVTGKEAAGKLLGQAASDSARLTGFFTAFAALAMVVAALVIANSFTILLAQRARELALLRCVGAGRGQVFTSVLAEAAAVGLIASVLGLFGGLGVAAALQALTGGPESGVYLPLSTRTILAALAIGVLVTVLASAFPAWTATRIPPVAALRTQVEGKSARAGRPRAVLAIFLLLLGLGLGALALNAEVATGATLTVLATVALLTATVTAGPLLAGPVVRGLGALTAPLLGQSAKLAALNADRNPKRTAASAAALTLGLAVVSLVTTVTAGVQAGQSRGLDRQLGSDYVVTSVLSLQPLPTALANTLAAVPGVAAVAPRRSFNGNLGGHGAYSMTAVRGNALGTLLRPAVLSGRLDKIGPGELAISTQLAKETGLAVGDTVQAGPRTKPVPLKVIAVYDGVRVPGADLGLALVDLPQQSAIALDNTSHEDSLLLALAPGTSPDQVRPALDQAMTTAPLARLSGVPELKEQLAAPLRRTLDLLWALTALSVLIAFAGIANTLSLSVLERTRESALLRALGLSRAGLAGSLAVESVFVALFGAATGLLLGLAPAWLLTRVASTEAQPVLFTLPWDRLAVLLAAALLAAPLAALIPARRAARVSLTAGMAPS
ncbi:ABC transporter permease [Crossiella cryophila]|uniref:Putative ABC transport system permease protein n=1 Tax=Crossiella cryophila TaxID=43355 RepID=A0A7W7FTI4_9PSEU|nr:ABC transporter permease [Crossiella cryophila]MBB4678201.1 putative ABC transport system permease protein [Crossiella cryophila]